MAARPTARPIPGFGGIGGRRPAFAGRRHVHQRRRCVAYWRRGRSDAIRHQLFPALQSRRRRSHDLQLRRHVIRRDGDQCGRDHRRCRRHCSPRLRASRRQARRSTFPPSAGPASVFFGGSFTNADTGVITGGIGGAGFGGTATLGPGSAGFGGAGLALSGGGASRMTGRSPAAPAPAEPCRPSAAGPAMSLAAGSTLMRAAPAEQVRLTAERPARPARSSTTPAESSAAAVAATGQTVRSTRPAHRSPPGPAAAAVSASAISSGSILNFGQILGGAAGAGANATVAGQVGGSDSFNSGGTARRACAEFSSSPPR